MQEKKKLNKKLILKSKLNKFKEWIIELIYPSNFSCIFCDEEISKLNKYNTCENCLKSLPIIKNQQYCAICGVPIKSVADICDYCFEKRPYFNIARAKFEYCDDVSKVIQNFKYNHAKYLFKPLAHFLADVYYENNFDCDYIIPTPLTKAKFKERGYNQAFLLAENLGKIINKPVRPDLVVKIRNTISQTMIKGLESPNRKEIRGKRILLIDDVMTTGSTLNTIAKLLKNYKAKEVMVITLARTNFYRAFAKRPFSLSHYIKIKYTKLKEKYKFHRLKIKLKKELNLKIKNIKKSYQKHINE